jgi:lambda family phage portal protein
MSKQNILDKIVSYVSPEKGLKRSKARILDEHLRKYEGASKSSRTSGWVANGNDSNSEIIPYVAILRNRSRDLVRNNPYGEKGIRAIATNVVGTGIIPLVKTANPKKVESARKIDALLKSWADKTTIDFMGKQNLYAMQSLLCRETAEAGQCFAVRRWKRNRNKNEIPFQVQLLEVDHLDLSYNAELQSGNSIKSGIETNAQGQIVAYHLFKSHPGQAYSKEGMARDRWPTEDVLTTFRMDRVGQNIGVPWLTPCLIRMKDFDEYEDAQLIKQKISAMFAGFITDLEGDVDEKEEYFEGGKIGSGLIKRLSPGSDIRFPNPPSVAEYSDYSTVSLRAISAGLGITYEVLTNDYSKVNFSSGRMGWIEFQRNINNWQAHMMITMFCHGLEKWFFEGCELIGYDVSDLFMKWVAPRREMIDPVKETNALIKQVRAGFKTLSAVISELGEDPDEHYLEIQSDNKTLDQLELVLDTDPRKTTNQGNVQPDGETKDE